MSWICPTGFYQPEDAGETPGELTRRDDEWKENAETIPATERKEAEGGHVEENADTEATEYQRQ